jgi:hypothetical protein
MSFHYLTESLEKYITYVKDRRFTNERQVMLVSLLHDESSKGYLNQYGRVETSSVLGVFDLGSFDFAIRNLQGNLRLLSSQVGTVNNYDVSLASYDIN